MAISIDFNQLKQQAQEASAAQAEQLKDIGVTKIGGKYYTTNTPQQQEQDNISTEKSALDLQNAQQAPTEANFPSALQTKIDSGQYTATGGAGKKNREELISEMQTLYGKQIDPNQIAASVYNTMKDTSGKTVTANDIKTKNDEADATAKLKAKADDSMGIIKTLVGQIQAASDAINTSSSPWGTASNPLQNVKGTLARLSGDQNAKFLDDQVQGLLSPLAADVLKVNRFNSGEIAKLNENIPKSGDTKQQAKVKMDRLNALINSKDQGSSTTSTTKSTSTTSQPVQTDPLNLFK